MSHETKSAIKVGDTVICVDDTASFHRLRHGSPYPVEAAYDGSPTVIVQGSYHSLERFRLTQSEVANQMAPLGSVQ